jgi:hypothetical protein
MKMPEAASNKWLGLILQICSVLLLFHWILGPARAQDRWRIETVDGGRGTAVGHSPSLAIDSAGNFHLGYIDTSRDVLLYAFHGVHEQQWDKMELDSSVGYSAVLALDARGRPHFAYQGYFENGLHYAVWDGSTWHRQLIDPSSVAFFLSMQIDKQGHPKISYYKRSNPDKSPALQLKYAFFDGSSWYRETIDPRYGTGKFNSLALDGEGNPHIVYSNIVSFDLEYAHWDGSQWVHNTPDTRSSSGGILGPSGLAIDTDGQPCFVYTESTRHQLKFAYKRENSWQTEVVQQLAGNTAQVDRISVKFDRQNRLHIAYVDYARNELKYGLRTSQGWRLEVVDPSTDSVSTPSLALDSNDMPHIAYFDESSGSVRVAHLETEAAVGSDGLPRP